MLRAALLLLLFLAAPAHADERRYMVTGFDRIRVDGPYEVEVTSGGAPGAVASGDARALDAVSVRVQGGTLIVGRGVNAWGGFPGDRPTLPRIVIQAADLRGAAIAGGGRLRIDRMRGLAVSLDLTGAGAIDVAAIDADRLQANLVGTGSLRVAGRVLRARFQSDGAGTIDAQGLDARAIDVAAQSAGDARFSASETATVTATGSGSVSVTGGAHCTVRGPGRVDCAGARD